MINHYFTNSLDLYRRQVDHLSLRLPLLQPHNINHMALFPLDIGTPFPCFPLQSQLLHQTTSSVRVPEATLQTVLRVVEGTGATVEG